MLVYVNGACCTQTEDMRTAFKAVQPYLSMKEMDAIFPDGSEVSKITIRRGNGELVWKMNAKETDLLSMFVKMYDIPTAVLFDEFGCPDMIYGELEHLFQKYADVICTKHSFYGTERKVVSAYVIDPESENVFSLD